jgi:Lrp/AsnC family transcriptional regulator, leucine-responsive regulatory protein
MGNSALDQKDRRILYELDRNARISYAQIGKKTDLSTEVVHYRVKRLEEKGVIAKYQTAVNYSKLGLIHFKVCLRFAGLALSAEEGLYSKIALLPQAIWIVKCSGEWDCIVSCTVQTLEEMDAVKDRILGIAGPYVNRKSFSILSSLWSFPREYIVGKKERPVQKTGGEKLKLDELDIKILRILSADARKPVIEIAAQTKAAVKTVTGRIKKLQKSGAINSFRLVIDYNKLGIHFYKTFFYLKKPDAARLKLLIAKLNASPNVVHNLKVIGEWDLEPEFEFENEDGFRKATQELMNEFSDVIERISVMDIVKEYKYTFFYK